MIEISPELRRRLQEMSAANILKMNSEFDVKCADVNPRVKRVGDITGSNVKTEFHDMDRPSEPWFTTPRRVLDGRRALGVTKRGEGKKKPRPRYMHFDLEVQDGLDLVFKADAALSMEPDNKKLQRQKRKEIRRLMESISNLSAFGVGTTTEQPDGTLLSEVMVKDLIEAGAVPDEYLDRLTDELLDSWAAY